MKTETYNALAALNRGFDTALESLTILNREAVLSDEYIADQNVLIEELRAGINHMILDKLEAHEEEDWAQFGKMRVTIEERQKHEATTTTGDSGEHADGEIQQYLENGSESPEGGDPEGGS